MSFQKYVSAPTVPALLPAAHETVRAHLDKLRLEGRAAVDADRWSVV